MVFQIVSTVRSRHNRAVRMSVVESRQLQQHVLGGSRRLIRGRPVVATEEELVKHLPELKLRTAQGLLQVLTADGRVVDLDTLTPTSEVPATPREKSPEDQSLEAELARQPGKQQLNSSDPATTPLQEEEVAEVLSEMGSEHLSDAETLLEEVMQEEAKDTETVVAAAVAKVPEPEVAQELKGRKDKKRG